MADHLTTIAELKQAVERFAAERNWEPFHSPKNLAMALAVEAAELMEPFLWHECTESRKWVSTSEHRSAVAEEMADVAILLLNMSLSTGIDLSDAIRAKLVRNAEKYPKPAEPTS